MLVLYLLINAVDGRNRYFMTVNNVKKLQKEIGPCSSKTEEMESMATSFFTKLYTSDVQLDPTEIMSLFQECISEQPFPENEISDALFRKAGL